MFFSFFWSFSDPYSSDTNGSVANFITTYKFIDNNSDALTGLLIVDGLEYLISNNTFNTVLKFIRHMVDDISETSFMLMIPVSPFTINEQELKILEREMEVLKGVKDVMMPTAGKLYAIK